MSTVGIIGLGLIGGSLARAYSAAGWQVLAAERDRSILEFARLDQTCAGELTAENAASCALILIAVSPEAAVEWLDCLAPGLPQTAVVVDCCGTKRLVCKVGFALAERYGFLFVGGHPMAGTHLSGYKNSRATLFKGAPMVLVPPHLDDMQLIDRVRGLLEPLQFGSFPVTTAEQHDRTIAFTSQLAHVVSNAYVKSPTAVQRRGFSAGSYRDLTRVAWLNAPMWTELFLENRDNLIAELDAITASLNEYRAALEENDAGTLCRLLEDGKKRKELVG